MFTFPIEYVDKDDPAYQKSPRFQTVLKPGKHGSSINDYIGKANDLAAAWESKILSESVPHIPAKGRKLSLEFLREEVSHIISQTGVEWVRGCEGILIRHHPAKRDELKSILSNLLSTHRLVDYPKLLSVRHEGEIFVFGIALQEDKYMPEDSVVTMLVNQNDPAAVWQVEPDRTDGIRFSHLYDSKEVMERFAVDSLRFDLSSRHGIPLADLKCRYEPLGKNSFPDFELIIDGDEWAVEVARVEDGMIAYVEVGRELDAKGWKLALQNRITGERVGNALQQEIEDKSAKRKDCRTYTRFCLLLVDVVDAIGRADSTMWSNCDLSSFDSVITVRFDGSVSHVKPFCW